MYLHHGRWLLRSLIVKTREHLGTSDASGESRRRLFFQRVLFTLALLVELHEECALSPLFTAVIRLGALGFLRRGHSNPVQ